MLKIVEAKGQRIHSHCANAKVIRKAADFQMNSQSYFFHVVKNIGGDIKEKFYSRFFAFAVTRCERTLRPLSLKWKAHSFWRTESLRKPTELWRQCPFFEKTRKPFRRRPIARFQKMYGRHVWRGGVLMPWCNNHRPLFPSLVDRQTRLKTLPLTNYVSGM